MINPREPVLTRLAIRELQGRYLRQREIVLPLRQKLRDQRDALTLLSPRIEFGEPSPERERAVMTWGDLLREQADTRLTLGVENEKLNRLKGLIQEAEAKHLRYLASRQDPYLANVYADLCVTETQLAALGDEIEELETRLNALRGDRDQTRTDFAHQRGTLKRAVQAWLEARSKPKKKAPQG